MMDAGMLLVRVTESQRTFSHHIDRAPTVRLQSICQSVTAPIWLATAPTVRLGEVGLWMDWQQNAHPLRYDEYPATTDNLICSRFVTTMKLCQPIVRRVVMSTADTYVRARIDTDTKERAADALEAMGLSISDAIRLLMLRIADERRLPFDVKVPNATTRKAIAELESGKGKRFDSVDALMADLNADD